MLLNKSCPTVAACHHEGIVDDAFFVLQEMARKGAPLRARRPRSAHVRPVRGPGRPGVCTPIPRLTRLGLAVLQPGGMLVQASCSNRVSAEAFFQTVEASVCDQGRSMRDVVCTGHAVDHPVRFAEGAYLKCLFARVS